MKLHFNPNQKHQLDAVDAVVRVLWCGVKSARHE